MTKKKSGNSKNQDDLILEIQDDVKTDLDPHLQDLILASKAGQEIDSSICERSQDGVIAIDVLAKLHDPHKHVPGLTVVRKIGQIVTATVNIDSIESVREHENIISLKRSTRLHKDLEFSVPEIRASQDQIRDELPCNLHQIDGSNVIVGIVDFGCDFVHHNFRNTDGTTRLLYLWDQGGGKTSISPQGFEYGREFNSVLINNALNSPKPYHVLAYRPMQAAHGTHVMDIAAGNGLATERPGVAPSADLIFVQVSAGDYEDEESFGNSRRLLEAVDYIFEKAQQLGKSAVINISLGTHGGPHDGTTLAEQGFDELLKTSGRSIVISAGNSWQRRSHASGQLDAGEKHILGWEITAGDATDNEIEVWYDASSDLDVTLVTPSGQRLGPVSPGTSVNLTQRNTRVGRIIHRQNDPNNQDNQVDILLDSSLPNGIWNVELQSVGDDSISFHSWIERDDYGQSKFVREDDDHTHTLGSISCGHDTLAIASYDARVPDSALSAFTAEGPTRDNRFKPEVSSPGHQILAARSLTQQSTRMSGTSMAAPHVTGLIALLMQAAKRPLTIQEIRDAVINNTRRNPPNAHGWHSRYGYGRVDAVAVVLTQLSSVHDTLPDIITANKPRSIVTGDKHPALFDDFLSIIVEKANQSQSRVRVQIEIDPLKDRVD